MAGLKKPDYPDDELFKRLKILLIIRTLFVTLFLSVITFINYKKLPELSLPVLSLYGLVIFAYSFNILSAIFLKRFYDKSWFTNAELLIDALFITLLIYVTGGSNSLLPFLYIFLILEGGYINFRKGAIIATSLSVVLYGALLELEFYKIVPYLSLIKDDVAINNTQQLLSLLSYYFIGFFAAGTLWGVLSEQFKRAHKTLKSLEGLTKIVFKRIPSGILTVDKDGSITSFNSAAEAITGLKAEEVFGRSLSEIFPNFRIENPQAMRNECIFKKRDGREVILGYSIGNLGEAGSVIIFQDLTRERQMEEDIKRSERLAALGRLSAGLAHEMRTIVASISASAQLLKSVESNKKEHDKLTQILLNESKRLNEIVTNFLNFSKPERDMSELFNIEQIIYDTIAPFEKNNSKNIKFTMEVDSKRIKIKGSRESMRQVFSNLLLNAIEAIAEEGSVAIKITDSQVQPDMTEISVTDNGCGIPHDVLPHIFEPFFTTKENGAGLGLATVYRIIEAHRGKISVESTPGRGTTFKILLPGAEVN